MVFRSIHTQGPLSTDSWLGYLRFDTFVCGGVVVLPLLIGIALGAYWGATSVSGEANTLALIPEGLICFSSNGVPSRIISYKEIEDIRFDSIKQSLIVTTSWSGAPKDDRKSLSRPVDIRGINEAPHIIAQRVERAYTSFKARNTLL